MIHCVCNTVHKTDGLLSMTSE